MSDVNLVANIFQKMKLHDLLQCKDILDSIINRQYVIRDEEIKAKHPKDFVSYEENILPTDSVQYAAIGAEVESLNLKKCTKSPTTKWLTLTGQEYSWETSTGNTTVKDPVELSKYPEIRNLMEHLNHKYSADLNSCLVSKYDNGNIYTGYHDDAEESLDPSQSLFIVSFGAQRSVDFIRQGDSNRTKPLLSLDPEDGSLYIMKSGCQQYFLHRLRRHYDNQTPSRFCLSFRRMKPANEVKEDISSSQLSSPVKHLISKFEEGELDYKPDSDVSQFLAPKTFTNFPKKKKTTVIFGTSITKRLDVHKLSSPGRKVLNLSESGAKIKHVSENIEYFHKNNKLSGDVEKLIISVGTNDVKYSRRGVQHLKRYLVDLILKCKALFPGAIVVFQCCLPIRNLYYYTVPNVLEFNTLLCGLCNEYNCIYLDCFRDFLDINGMDQSRDLFYDWLHLNYDGIAALAVWFNYVIKENSYNHIIY